MLPGLHGIVGPSHRVISQTYTGTAASSSNLTTYTFSGASLGEVASDRYIVVAVSNTYANIFFPAAAPLVSSVTVAGQSCSKVADALAPGWYGAPRTTLWITNAPITSGTAGDIVVAHASSCTSAAVAAWAVFGISSTTPHATGTDTGYGPLSANLNHPSNGVLIAVASISKADSGASTWTGATEDFEGTDGASKEFTGASKQNLTQASAQTVQVSHSLDTDPADTWHSMVAATWS